MKKTARWTLKKFLHMMKDEVIPAIQDKLSWENKVWVQIDSAPPHVGLNGINHLNDHCRQLTKPKIEFFTQPPQSPDLNANDLGFFNSIKKNIDQSYVGVLRKEQVYQVAVDAFAEYSSNKLAGILRAKSHRIRQVYDDHGKVEKVKIKV